jgi:hypothetical protein
LTRGRAATRAGAQALLAVWIVAEVLGVVVMLLPGNGLTLLGFGGVSVLFIAVAARTLPVALAYMA